MVQRTARTPDQDEIPQTRAGNRCRTASGTRLAPGFSVAPGFSLVELIVVMSIVVVLVGLLLPSLREVREATRRLQCGNHIRMLGIGIIAYGGDFAERLPYSQHAERKVLRDLMALTVAEPEPRFDGLGLLLPFQGRGYVDSPSCFFCPSHCGEHEAERNMPLLARPGPSRIFGNYHYRGHLAANGGRLTLGSHGDRLIVLTDGLRTRSDFSHVSGSNLLRSDGSVQWWYDSEDSVARSLPLMPVAEGPDPAFEEFFYGLIARIGQDAR